MGFASTCFSWVDIFTKHRSLWFLTCSYPYINPVQNLSMWHEICIFLSFESSELERKYALCMRCMVYVAAACEKWADGCKRCFYKILILIQLQTLVRLCVNRACVKDSACGLRFNLSTLHYVIITISILYLLSHLHRSLCPPTGRGRTFGGVESLAKPRARLTSWVERGYWRLGVRLNISRLHLLHILYPFCKQNGIGMTFFL